MHIILIYGENNAAAAAKNQGTPAISFGRGWIGKLPFHTETHTHTLMPGEDVRKKILSQLLSQLAE